MRENSLNFFIDKLIRPFLLDLSLTYFLNFTEFSGCFLDISFSYINQELCQNNTVNLPHVRVIFDRQSGLFKCH